MVLMRCIGCSFMFVYCVSVSVYVFILSGCIYCEENYIYKVVTSEALGPGSVLRKGKRESPGEEECL